jgi:hypothetical protein
MVCWAQFRHSAAKWYVATLGARPKGDVASEIAQALGELERFRTVAWSTRYDRRDEYLFCDKSDEDLLKRIAELEHELGYASSERKY